MTTGDLHHLEERRAGNRREHAAQDSGSLSPPRGGSTESLALPLSLASPRGSVPAPHDWDPSRSPSPPARTPCPGGLGHRGPRATRTRARESTRCHKDVGYQTGKNSFARNQIAPRMATRLSAARKFARRNMFRSRAFPSALKTEYT